MEHTYPRKILIFARATLALTLLIYIGQLSGFSEARLGYSIEKFNAYFFIASLSATLAYVIGIMLSFVDLYFNNGSYSHMKEMLFSLVGVIIVTILYLSAV